MSDIDEVITPYQARLYNAVIYGERHGQRHVKAGMMPLLRRLWTSRRFWQARALADDETINLIGALCEAEQRRAGIVNAFVRTDHVLYALYRDGEPPQGWDQVRFAAEQILHADAA
ncbi:hypothetical protein ACFO5K_04390 [Nocardia halotolerans]|uniref:Uncharacterized protein n=1 Tax=Nocardia halotolerans TaxID=1755878 RepID=A0ABV8VBP0_9NOCA